MELLMPSVRVAAVAGLQPLSMAELVAAVATTEPEATAGMPVLVAPVAVAESVEAQASEER